MKTATSSPLVPVDVAVGIVRQPTGEMLLARRPVDKPYAGYWEFPGGKIEASESIFTALQRELMERTGHPDFYFPAVVLPDLPVIRMHMCDSTCISFLHGRERHKAWKTRN